MKTLNQIQEENRKAIKLLHQCIRLVFDDKEEYVQSIMGKPLTLDRVLIALDQSPQGECLVINTSGNFYRNCLVKNNDDVDACGFGMIWDLTKPTLEEQTEETQRRINELLNNKENND